MRRAFTLIEFLVVITIIVVLISLLVPAMNKAMYETQLLMCATNLKGVASGSIGYAMDNKQMYPKAGKRVGQPGNLVGEGPDWRPQLRRAFDLNNFLNCPLNAPVDFETHPPAS